jgi:hypothetical protein
MPKFDINEAKNLIDEDQEDQVVGSDIVFEPLVINDDNHSDAPIYYEDMWAAIDAANDRFLYDYDGDQDGVHYNFP